MILPHGWQAVARDSEVLSRVARGPRASPRHWTLWMEPLRKEWFKWFGLDSIRHHRKVDESNGYSNLSMDEPRCNLSTKMRIPQQNLAQLRQLSDMRSLLDNGTPIKPEVALKIGNSKRFFCNISLD